MQTRSYNIKNYLKALTICLICLAGISVPSISNANEIVDFAGTDITTQATEVDNTPVTITLTDARRMEKWD